MGPPLGYLASPNMSEACLSKQYQDMGTLHNKRMYRIRYRTHTRQYTGLHTDRASH